MFGWPVVARLLLYLGVMMALGHSMMALLERVPRPRNQRWLSPGPAQWFTRIGALFLVLAPLLMLMAQLAALDMTRADIPTLVGETGWGRGWSQLMLACVVASVLLVLHGVLVVRRAGTMVLLAASGTVAIAMSGIGHAAAAETWRVTVRAVDALHVVAMGAWLGGLAATLVTTHNAGFDRAATAWRSFSRVATVMAPITVLTGLMSSARLLLGIPLPTIVASSYARLLAIKVLSVLIVLGIGFTQRRRIARREVPASRTIAVELGVAAAILLLTAILTGAEPPSPE